MTPEQREKLKESIRSIVDDAMIDGWGGRLEYYVEKILQEVEKVQ